jgi:hypothetical protein
MKYLIGLILSILVILFIIIKLLSGGGGGNGANTSITQTQPKSLADYADTDVTVRYTIDNPVQAPATHRDIIITVGRDSADLTVTKGYDGEVIKHKAYPNSENSYANFLMALDRSAKFTKGKDDPSLRDGRGYCATRDRFIYEIVAADGSLIQHFWSTSCRTATFEGDNGITRDLFISQIPDFDALTLNVSY